MGSHAEFAELLKLMDSGAIKPVIDCEIPLRRHIEVTKF